MNRHVKIQKCDWNHNTQSIEPNLASDVTALNRSYNTCKTAPTGSEQAAFTRVHFPVVTAFRGFVDLACAMIRSEEHTSELQSLMRISYAVFFLKKKKKTTRRPK